MWLSVRASERSRAADVPQASAQIRISRSAIPRVRYFARRICWYRVRCLQWRSLSLARHTMWECERGVLQWCYLLWNAAVCSRPPTEHTASLLISTKRCTPGNHPAIIYPPGLEKSCPSHELTRSCSLWLPLKCVGTRPEFLSRINSECNGELIMHLGICSSKRRKLKIRFTTSVRNFLILKLKLLRFEAVA